MAAALLALARVWLDIGWRPFLLRALDAVSATFDLIQLVLLSWWVPSLIAALNVIVPWDLHLPSDWRNLFTLLTLYLSSHVREARAANVPNRALALSWRILAALVGLVLATSLAVLLASGGFDRLETAVMGSLLGIVVYRLGFAAQFAYDRSAAFTNRQIFRAEFLRKALGGLYIALGGAAVLVAARFSFGGTDDRWDFGGFRVRHAY
jgi:hypothetical protein